MPPNVLKLRREECAILPLVLKGRWFDMIAAGEKREEYRANTRYWSTRLRNWAAGGKRKGILFQVVEFRRGYSANAARCAFLADFIDTTEGLLPYAIRARNPSPHISWGEPHIPHYVIKLGPPVILLSRSPSPAKVTRI